ncbi:MAG: type II secretion system protein GspL [Pseudomonadota bacterium]|uniref:type II secretion system protein GspL n=1 Tax=Pseudoalteromonas spongiae TaxID=298657 RepID=UPI000C2D3D7A|nr:type II secretion system protein GspL [Pseudoalteromonas spongiae]MEC8325558.1 type II secretion system protein GspL [Pseudomonadota bacterium]
MKETLIIRLGQSVNDPIHWLISNANETIASGRIDNSLVLEELAEKAQSREVIALFPASKVQLKTVVLPTKYNRKLESALPFMLEEELACELDDVLISIGEPCMLGEKHALQVAVCQRAWFENWLDILKTAELSPTRALPDALLLPQFDDADVTVTALENNWLFRLDAWRIAEVETSWINEFTATLDAQSLAHLSDLEFEYDNAVKKLEHYDLPLAIFTKQLATQPFNMLQGAFQVKKQSKGVWPVWQVPAIAAGVALMFGLVLKAVTAYQLEQKVAVAKAETIEAYQQAFPGSKVRPNLIRRQIQSKLSQVSSGGETGFLFLLHHLTPVFKDVEGFTPETLRFDSKRGELRLRASAKDFQSFNVVKQRLERSALQVEQGSLSNSGNLVVGEIKIKAGS